MRLLVRNARVVTLAGPVPRRGAALAELGVIPTGHVVVEDDRIAAAGAGEATGTFERIIDARGRVLMPGFVDAHTHACRAGSRLDEWELRLAGASYLDVLARGGGILATVRATRAATEDELVALLVERARVALREGTTTLEVKSGYGLDAATELKMLRAIRRAAVECDASGGPTIVATACLGHAIDPDHPGGREAFVRETIETTLPAVHAEHPGIAVDAYCEEGAWTPSECARLLEAASALGHPIRVHASQFHDLGMTEWAIAHGARSVDHLEASGDDALVALARSSTFGVMLPASSFHVGGAHARGRRFVDEGGALVVATNENPGTSPCSSIPMALAFAVRLLGISPAEAIASATANAAALLGLPDRGRIEPGLRADLILLRHRDEREVAFALGDRAVDVILRGGRIAD